MKSKKILKYSTVLYTGVVLILGVCQFLGVPNLDISSIQDRVLLGAVIWWLGVFGVAMNAVIIIKIQELRVLATILLLLCAVSGLIGGFHYYLAANWS